MKSPGSPEIDSGTSDTASSVLRGRSAEGGPARWCRPAPLVAGVLLLILGGCSSPAGPPPPDVLVLVVDCLRADHLGAYGYERDTSPVMDGLAADGVRFDRAVAQSNWTRASVASLFTGLYLSQHRVPGIGEADVNPELREARAEVDELEGMRILGGNALSEEFVTVGEVASQAGYHTAAFINQAQMPPYIGFAQGFDVYEMSDSGDRGVVESYEAWLEGETGAPRFAYLHLLMLHYPYTPPPRHDRFRETHELFPADAPPAVRRRTLRNLDPRPEHGPELAALYDGQIHRADGFVGRILDALRRQQLYDDTLVVLTSDHGEAFFEHGHYKHGYVPFDEVLRVPLVVSWPRGLGDAGRVVEGLAWHLDLLPTLAGLAGAPAPDGLAGRDLSPVLRGRATIPAGRTLLPAVLELAHREPRPLRRAVVRGGWKWIEGSAAFGDAEGLLFDLRADPGESRDLREQRPRRSAALAAAARRWSASLRPATAASQRGDLTGAQRDRLRALGYAQ